MYNNCQDNFTFFNIAGPANVCGVVCAKHVIKQVVTGGVVNSCHNRAKNGAKYVFLICRL